MHKSPSFVPRLLGAGAYGAPRGKDYPVHAHNCWELLYYRAGHIELVIDGRAYPTEPGAVLLTPPQTPHAERALTAYANYHVTLDAPANMPWPVCCYDDPELSLKRIFGALVAEFCSVAPDRALMLDLLTRELDLHLRRAAARPPRIDAVAAQIVRRAELLFENQVATPVSIAAVAGELHVAPSTLRAHFVKIRGRSPQQRLLDLRVQRARALLKTSNLTLEAIAELCGFYSASHLTRHFKRRHGQSPGQARRA